MGIVRGNHLSLCVFGGQAADPFGNPAQKEYGCGKPDVVSPFVDRGPHDQPGQSWGEPQGPDLGSCQPALGQESLLSDREAVQEVALLWAEGLHENVVENGCEERLGHRHVLAHRFVAHEPRRPGHFRVAGAGPKKLQTLEWNPTGVRLPVHF